MIAWVIDNSLDPSKVARAEEWERTLEAYIAGLAGTAHEARCVEAYIAGFGRYGARGWGARRVFDGG